MQYRRLGNSGLIVSALSLGTMQFGQAMNVGRLDQQATTAMVRRFIAHLRRGSTAASGPGGGRPG